MQELGFEVRDVESLREHYALTVSHWRRRLEANRERAVEVAGDVTYRVWRLGMAGFTYGQEVGRLNLWQSLLVKPGPGGRSGLPLTREDWYA
jgi:cyclopropane-fatty-acyl-phospholipid synthase